MRRREMLALAVLGGILTPVSARACRAPQAKDRSAYSQVINTLFTAWWSRDYPTFSALFQHPDVAEPFRERAVFDQHFGEGQPRQLGSIMFNGPSAVVQVITPRGPDAERGICGGHAWADLVLVKFYPGIESPVVAELRYLDGATLAASEWAVT